MLCRGIEPPKQTPKSFEAAATPGSISNFGPRLKLCLRSSAEADEDAGAMYLSDLLWGVIYLYIGPALLSLIISHSCLRYLAETYPVLGIKVSYIERLFDDGDDHHGVDDHDSSASSNSRNRSAQSLRILKILVFLFLLLVTLVALWPEAVFSVPAGGRNHPFVSNPEGPYEALRGSMRP